MPHSAFYRDLVPLPSFEAAMDTQAHVELPDDWWVVIADVVNSTQAIADGAYKKVNTVGVACIAAIANIDRSLELPFIFGGDGATCAVPDSLREQTIVALRGTQRLAAESFGLILRAGLVRVAELRAEGRWTRVAKIPLSPLVMLPVFSGRGWEAAEQRVRVGQGALIVDPDGGPAEASFEGFECRWQNVPSFRDAKLSLIVVATSPDAQLNQQTYERLLASIRRIFGDPGAHHPLRVDGMHLAFSPMALAGETMVRTFGSSGLAKLGYALRMLLQNIAGWWLFARKIDTQTVRWSRYRDDMVRNTDFRKFDGALRMVLDASAAQVEELERWLATERSAGRLAWGLHKSREALITCLVEAHEGRHLHFVDGSDGGYALAARQLKAQLAERD